AAAAVAPGRNLPATVSRGRSRSEYRDGVEPVNQALVPTGTHNCDPIGPGIAPANSGGATPTISNGRPESRTVFPTTCGSASNPLRQRSSLSTKTEAGPGSSVGRMARPRAALTPSV